MTTPLPLQDDALQVRRMNYYGYQVGDIATVTGSAEVPDGEYEIVETLPFLDWRMCRFGKYSCLRVLAPTRRDASWPPHPWWVEDDAVVGVRRDAE